MLDNKKYPKRHSIRIMNYNYAQEGMYFITICVKNRECLLGKIIKNQMQLNNNGKLIEGELLKINLKFQQANIHIYQIMPNHIHLILELRYETKQTIGDIVRYLKGRCSFKAKINWQRNYYEHIVRDEKEYYAICDYIINNPLNWEEDMNYK